MFQYLNSGGTLVPFALIPNKLLLTDAASVERNKAMMRDLFGGGLAKADVPFHDSTIDVYSDLAWTVLSTDGTSAPLLRGPTVVALRQEVADLKLEVVRLARQRSALKRRLRAATAGTVGPSGRADALPAVLRRPARATYRAVTRLRG